MQGWMRQPEAGTGRSQSPRAGRDQGPESKEEIGKNKTKQQNPSQTPGCGPLPPLAGPGLARPGIPACWAGRAGRPDGTGCSRGRWSEEGSDPQPTREWLGLSVLWSPPTAPPKPPASGSMAGETAKRSNISEPASPPPPAPFGSLSLPMARIACSQPGFCTDQGLVGGGVGWRSKK